MLIFVEITVGLGAIPNKVFCGYQNAMLDKIIPRNIIFNDQS